MPRTCERCSTPITGTRRKRFCSDACRMWVHRNKPAAASLAAPRDEPEGCATRCPFCGKYMYSKNPARVSVCHTCRRDMPREVKEALGIVRPRKPRKISAGKPRGRCSGCGKPVHVAGTSRPNPMCQPCRRVAREATVGTPCEMCGSPTNPHQKRRFCSGKCAGKADSARRLALRGEGATTHTRRVDREAAAAGLGPADRKRLRQKWKRQGRACAYCPAPATTIDHVIPLIRGGTNYEGNLVPCCLSCNSRKSDRLVIEFRLGLRASQTYTPFRGRPKVERTVKAKAQRPEKPTSPCLICRQPCVRKTCSRPCAVEWNTRQIREAYRARVGLPPTWDVPTRPRRARPAA